MLSWVRDGDFWRNVWAGVLGGLIVAALLGFFSKKTGIVSSPAVETFLIYGIPITVAVLGLFAFFAIVNTLSERRGGFHGPWRALLIVVVGTVAICGMSVLSLVVMRTLGIVDDPAVDELLRMWPARGA